MNWRITSRGDSQADVRGSGEWECGCNLCEVWLWEGKAGKGPAVGPHLYPALMKDRCTEAEESLSWLRVAPRSECFPKSGSVPECTLNLEGKKTTV